MATTGVEGRAAPGPEFVVPADLRGRFAKPWFAVLAGLLFVASLSATWFHYDGSWPGNETAWAAWLLSVAAFATAFARPLGAIAAPAWSSASVLRVARSEAGIGLITMALFLVTHLWNFQSAPWNTYGLFDDGAWDLYFARNHAFVPPYQPAFYDNVGVIARETLFHYVITAGFKVFGYNLVVFNGLLLALGAVTVLFTTLAVKRLTGSALVALLAGIALNVFPLHYLHIFVGHRYAVAAPVMAVSLYFLYSGFQDRSGVRLTLSAFFAALCLGSSIMGKQYILGLALAAVLIPIADPRRWRTTSHRASAATWVAAFVISAMPLLVYIRFNTPLYFGRESGLLRDFVEKYTAGGIDGIRPYFETLGTMFFAEGTFHRMWLHDYPLIPLAWWPLLVGGLVVALARRRFEIVFLAFIPVGSALLAGAFEFRVLLSAPIWIMAVALAIDAALRAGARATGRLSTLARPLPAVGVGLLALGIAPSAAYLWYVSTDTHHQYLFNHRDVAVGRQLQDIAAGSSNPTIDVKPDELSRGSDPAAAPYDLLACPATAYAVAHSYLQGFGDRRILAFCDQGNEALHEPARLVRSNTVAVQAYQPRGAPLKLVWEEYPNAVQSLALFRRLGVGSWSTIPGSLEGRVWTLHVLTIPPEEIRVLQQRLADLAPVVAP